MNIKTQVIDYLKHTYTPISILLYGSYADGTNDETSDFDCIIIVHEKEKRHDNSVINGVPLDCFIFTKEETLSDDIDAFLTVYDAQIICDDGTGAELKSRVREYVHNNSIIDSEEKHFIAEWILKTVHRSEKGDDEGRMRMILFLQESLADYCLLRDQFYFGSKKTIRKLQLESPKHYEVFHEAITQVSYTTVKAWAEAIIDSVMNVQTV